MSLLPMASFAAEDEVALLDGLGNHEYDITTDSELAQNYFNQGLRLYYAFNHPEAIRSFREAQRLDPSCAMCFWGEALAYGPNINLPMDEASGVAAHEAVQKAKQALDEETAKERELISALDDRYVAEQPEDRSHLDQSYAETMAQLAERYPNDDEIQTLRAEALMDLRPWDYWTETGEPKEGMEEALERLKRVVARSPEHPGACHFYIHAVEKVYPERAVPCADRLAALMPAAGHLVHMPGHIYIRVGRYEDAIAANEHATHADESYIQDQRPGANFYTAGYYPHNYDFLAFAALMIGRGEQAIAAAEKVRELVPEEMLGTPGMDFLQHWRTRPLQVQVRTGDWQAILDTPAPGADLPHAQALWHYARGRALAATEDIAGAEKELQKLTAIANGPEVQSLKMEFNRSPDILAVGRDVLAGRIASTEGDHDKAADLMQQAVEHEDALLYGEPPEWSVPVRQEQGEVLLEAERYERAAQAFREDLDRFPGNGWSLHGLAEAERGMGNDGEAREIEKRFEDVWAEADVELATR
ncbi:hypothetical protein F6455_06960 [Proteobacteria bacterium 005FR1]|nr:hypothetical protein [Proteobacteria bacterium 005FR1]